MTSSSPVQPPRAAVIIPHYNDVDRLEKCLCALLEETAHPALLDAVEIVVADNNSTAPLDALKARFTQVCFVTEPQKGAGAARNCGVAATTAPRLFFIDADCVPAPDWLDTALRAVEGCDLVGGRVDTFDETPKPRSGAEAFETVFAFNQRSYVEEKNFSVTANLLTWRRIFEDVGPFNNGVSEDVDWCLRARDAGYRIVYEPDLAVAHPTRNDWAALIKKWKRLASEMFLLNGTSFGARARWFGRSALIAGAVLPYTVKILRNGRLDGMGEKLSAIGTLYRLHGTRMLWMWRQALLGR